MAESNGPLFKRRRVAAKVGTQSRTKQDGKEAADVNNIVARYRASGDERILGSAQGVYGDFSGLEDYKTCLDRVLAAQANFDALPSRVRNHVKNDPAELIRLVEDESRRLEAQELGVIPTVVPSGGETPPSEPDPVPAPAPEPAPAEPANQ